MAVHEVMVTVTECDSCGRKQHMSDQDYPPPGYYGTVSQVTSIGAPHDADWYACRPAHIRAAVERALTRALADG